ncbi:transporter substrate-binding domain-containing protein [Chitinivorax sp. B]|uniref:substrate-binding periplasmic protein n=1 Tax=Chitinivorax sp. B TaxID=2502235 RepID=UPI001484F77F|nr:transporter substrate-binding domain-containing protein [Chitinivorax sp. B]
MTKWIATIYLAAWSGLLQSAHAVDKVVRIAATEWPPYAGAALPENGLSSAIAAAALAKLGYTLKIEYFPWTRAVMLGERDNRYDGYFPAYYTEDRAKRCHFSTSLGTSPIGFAYLKQLPFEWHNMEDLTDIPIGVVKGYANGEAFDTAMRSKRLQAVDEAVDDATNLRKLAGGRLRLAVVDRNVMYYLFASTPKLKPERNGIAFHPKLLSNLSIHICFKQTQQHRILQERFDETLRGMHIPALESRYLKHFSEDSGNPR